MGNAGILLTQVQFLKDKGHKHFVIVDAGMNDLIRPAIYSAYHHIVPVVERDVKYIKTDVVGPICETGDFLALDRRFPMWKGETTWQCFLLGLTVLPCLPTTTQDPRRASCCWKKER